MIDFDLLKKRMGLGLAWGLAGVLLAFLYFRSGGYFYDFHNYWRQANLIFTGGNPYIGSEWLCSYPPIAMNIFRPFLFIPIIPASLIWLTLRVIVLVFQLRLWNKHFVKLQWNDPITVFFFLLAFNGALFYDFESGNIAGFQQLPLWIGFVALMQRRYVAFSVAVVAMACFKLDLLALLGLLLLDDEGPHWKVLLSSVLVYGLWVGLNATFYPELFRSYVTFLTTMSTLNQGVNNPSTSAFLRELCTYVGGWQIWIPMSARLPFILYVLSTAFVVASSTYAWRGFSGRADRRWLVGIGCVIFGLINPRIPPYLYPMMLIPAFLVLKDGPAFKPLSFAYVLIILPQFDNSFPRPVAGVFKLFNIYLPLMGLYATWFLYMQHFLTHRRNTTSK